MDVLMARQPIFDANLKVVAYELLYRSADQKAFAAFLDGDKATSEVVINAYTSIYEACQLRRLPAFINLTQELVCSDRLPNLSQRLIVVELLENAVINSEFIAGVTRLVNAGYRIALDDFIYKPKYKPLLEMVHIVKLDLRAQSAAQLEYTVKKLAPYNLTLLAEKVETETEFEMCREMGFKLFQGYFLAKPELVEGRKLAASQTVILQLLNALQNPSVDPMKIEELVVQDPHIYYKLLKLVNSAHYALPREVTRIAEAIVYIGNDELRRWVALIAFSERTGRPTELTRHLLIKARMCELVSGCHQHVTASSAFMAGVLEGMEALLGIPREQVLDEVLVDEAISRGVLEHTGPYGDLLVRVESVQQGRWHELAGDPLSDAYHTAYLQSLTWSREIMEQGDHDH